tara:strand:- start:1804 stop:2076 length:273 start_codon:yes stop_codon:yes gene_type:complete
MRKKIEFYRTEEKLWKCWVVGTPKGDFICTKLETGGIYAVPAEAGMSLWEFVRSAMSKDETNMATKAIVDDEMPAPIIDENEILTGDMDK